jgi:magnesium-transporting ATPase (P-type)
VTRVGEHQDLTNPDHPKPRKEVHKMWQIALRIGMGLLLVIHGFAHWQITTAWGSKTSVSSWLLPNVQPATLQSLGTFLWVATLLAFVATGIVLMAGWEWWRTLAVVSSLLSLLVIGIFWQPNMMLGAAVNVGVLIALLWIHWPTPQLLGT